jgi:lipopolysaccharide/colanic/teichoic acid biosynthesis glycosyltransferase
MSAAPKLPTPRPTAPAAPPEREPWPEIDRLPAGTVLDLPANLGWYAAAKTAFDYAAALALLPLAAVLVALAAAAVKLTSPGPVFYAQTRVGLNGRKYKIIKVRTMRANCEAASGIQWSQKGDSRVTRVGRFLRATHIDELPQLLNVLLGQMSLVGPRPERPEVIQAKGLNQLVPGYRHRLRVKPGVTGLAQCQLPADSDVTSVRYKVVYDLYYVEHMGPLLDLRLVAATAFKAAKLGPRALRLLFLLPGRRCVAAAFHNRIVPPPDATPVLVLQPA